MPFTRNQMQSAFQTDDSTSIKSLNRFREEDTTNLFEDIAITGARAVTGLTNTGIAVGNFFGADTEEVSPTRLLNNKLGDAYTADPSGYDTAGDLIGGFLPGLGAIGVLRKAKTAQTGLSNFWRIQNYHKKEKQILISARRAIRDNPITPDLKSTRKALIGNRAKSGAIEGAAFELSAYAGTTLKTDLSNDELDAFDIITKVGTQALIGGTFGGVVEGLIAPLGLMKGLTNYASRVITRTPGYKDILINSADELVAGSRVGFLKSQMTKLDELKDVPLNVKTLVFGNAKEARTRAVKELIDNLDDDNPLFDQVLKFVDEADDRAINSMLTHVSKVRRATAVIKRRAIPKSVAPNLARAQRDLADSLPGKRVALVELKEAFDALPIAQQAQYKGVKKFFAKEDLAAYTKNYAWASLKSGAIDTAFTPRWIGDQEISAVRKGLEVTVDGRTIRYGDKTKNALDAQAKWLIAAEHYLTEGGARSSFPTLAPDDLPRLEALFHRVDEIVTEGTVPVISVKGTSISSKEGLKTHILQAKEAGIAKYMASHPEASFDEVAGIFNVRIEALESLSYAEKNLDQWLPMSKTDYREIRNVQLELEAHKFSFDRDMAMHFAKQESEQVIAHAKVQARKIYGSNVNFPELDELSLLSPFGSSASLAASSTSKGYINAIQQKMARIGAIIHEKSTTQFSKFADELAPSIAKFADDPEAFQGFVTMRTWYESQAGNIVFDSTNKVLKIKGLAPDAELIHGQNAFELTNANLYRFVQTWQKSNKRLAKDKARVLNGKQRPVSFDPNDFYLPPTPIKYGAILFRKGAMAGNARGGILRANNAEDLSKLMDNVRKEGVWNVLPINKTADYYDALGRYELDKSFVPNSINSQFQKKGLAAPIKPSLDVQAHLDDLQAYAFSRIKGNMRGAMELQYSREFHLLDSFHNISSSNLKTKKGDPELIETIYSRAKKTALDIRQNTQLKSFDALNDSIEKWGSQGINRVKSIYDKVSNTKDIPWKEVNDALEEIGLPPAYSNLSDALLASSKDLDKPVVQQYIAKANGILSTMLLRFAEGADALINTLSYSILAGPELKAIMRQVDLEGQGKLNKFLTIGDEAGDWAEASWVKSFLRSQKKYTTPEGKAEIDDWVEKGLLKSQDALIRDMTGQAIMTSRDTVKSIRRKSVALDKSIHAAKKVGFFAADAVNNRLQYAAIRLARDIADIAKLSDADFEVLGHTLKGRILAMNIPNQKPTVFQGPIGTAISLFQNYQLNMISTITRHISDGNTKSLATMTALQGSIFGLQGIPGYQQINAMVHKMGSGETEDLNSVIEGSLGEEGLWLLYGSASEGLGTALYTRGDLNPRNQFIIPTNPAEVPIMRAMKTLATEAVELKDNITRGAPVGASILDAVAHTGLNRPIANLIEAQRGFATSQKGTYLYDVDSSFRSDDDFSLENLKLDFANVMRYAGARPFDEALLREKNYRYTSYHAESQRQLNKVSKAIKLSLANGDVSQSAVDNFMREFVKAGRKPEDFDSWYNRITANASKTMQERLEKKLQNSPLFESYSRMF